MSIMLFSWLFVRRFAMIICLVRLLMALCSYLVIPASQAILLWWLHGATLLVVCLFPVWFLVVLLSCFCWSMAVSCLSGQGFAWSLVACRLIICESLGRIFPASSFLQNFHCRFLRFLASCSFRVFQLIHGDFIWLIWPLMCDIPLTIIWCLAGFRIVFSLIYARVFVWCLSVLCGVGLGFLLASSVLAAALLCVFYCALGSFFDGLHVRVHVHPPCFLQTTSTRFRH